MNDVTTTESIPHAAPIHTLSTIFGILNVQAATIREASATAATVTVSVWFSERPISRGDVSLVADADGRQRRFIAAGASPDAWIAITLRGALFDLKDDEFAAACTILEACAADATITHLASLANGPSVPPVSTIDRICAEGRDVNDARREILLIAIALGANDKILITIRDAMRVSRTDTVVLPPGRFEHLSRGKGWARLGKGDNVTWGERAEKGGYRVGPGKWAVGSSDGYTRKDSIPWTVKHITVGAETWTVAS